MTSFPPHAGAADAVGPRNRTLAIFLVSVLGLFLEMLLIRWIGTEIRIFAYLQNTILIVCFLGLGLGCFTCRQELRLRRTLLPLLCLASLLAVPATRGTLADISGMLSVLDDLLIWENGRLTETGSLLPVVGMGLLLTLLLMFLVCEAFIPLGRLLGRLMDDHPRTVWAYSVNVAGSLLGILLFALLSALYASPWVWFAVAAAMLAPLVVCGKERLGNVGMLAAMVLAVWVSGRQPEALEVTWSPYQKLVLSENDDAGGLWRGKYLITVNNVGYQGIADLSEEGIRNNPRITAEGGLSQYDAPLLFKPQPERVLIVGAGSGNDAAGALRGGARHVTAVDIDPAIIDMGRRYHPERPYDSPRVRVVNDDARSFFATTTERYDLIIFGLLDSHTMTSMTNARLDHYVYTRESIERAKSLLTDDGVLVLTFMAHRTYIADRIASCLTQVFGESPLAFTIPSSEFGWGGVMFVTGDRRSLDEALAGNERLARQIAAWQEAIPLSFPGTTEIAADDWPYLYLEGRRIPTLYYLLGALMAFLVLHYRKQFRIWGAGGERIRWRRTHLHFFFLGAAFLLLEVQNISKASVVLGNTWTVNAVIVSGILLMILLANAVAARWPRLPQSWLGAGLIGVCAVLYFVDLSRFGFLPYAAKAAIVGGLTTLPMAFAGVIFIQSFAQVKRKDHALGANLLGALVGGLLESITFVTGIKTLLLLVAALYAMALYTSPQRAGREEEPEEDPAAEATEDETAERREAVGV